MINDVVDMNAKPNLLKLRDLYNVTGKDAMGHYNRFQIISFLETEVSKCFLG